MSNSLRPSSITGLVTVGGYMIANTPVSLADSTGKYHHLETGTALLVTEKNPAQSYRSPWLYKVLSNDNILLVDSNACNNFVFSKAYPKILEGKCFCITGELSQPRPVFATLIALCGGEWKASMSGRVTHLVSNGTRYSTKAKKALADGVAIITEKQFVAFIDEYLANELRKESA